MAQQSVPAKWKSLLLKEGNVPTKHPRTTTESLYQHKELTLKLKTSIIYQKKKSPKTISPSFAFHISLCPLAASLAENISEKNLNRLLSLGSACTPSYSKR